MVENTLKAVEICRIISTCSKSGVAELKFGNLDLTFHPQGPAAKELAPSPDPIPEQLQLQIQTDLPLTRTEAQLLDDRETREAMEAQAAIEDPLYYEKLQMSEGLELDRVDDETAQY